MHDTVQSLIDRNLPADRGRVLKPFAERLFARLSPEVIGRLGPERLVEIAERALEFFSMRVEPVSMRFYPGIGQEGTTVLESTMPDCPFIVDSVLEYFHELGVPLRMLLHPIFHVSRDADGRLASLEQNVAAERSESLIHAEIEHGRAPEPIAAELKARLGEVLQVNADFGAMTARALAICEETAPYRELIEIRDLLRWLVQGGFVFLGYRRYLLSARNGRPMLEVEPDSGLGILRAESRSRFARQRPLDEIDQGLRKLLFEGPALLVGNTRARSRVHRAAAMTDLTIRRTDEGRVVAFDRFLGLFTSKAYAEEAAHVPVLRAKLREVLAAERAIPGSHDFKEIVGAFNSFPKEELFRASVAELRAQIGDVLDLETDPAVRMHLFPDPDRRNVIALVMMPRERFSADVRMEIQRALARGLAGSLLYYHLMLGESYSARLHFCFSAPPPSSAVIARLSAEVAGLTRSWEDRLREHLIATFGEERGDALAQRWPHAFGPGYKATTGVERAAGDIERFEAMLSDRSAAAELSPANEGGDGSSQLRIFEVGKAAALSELMPILQNCGVRVLSEDAHELSPLIDGNKIMASVQAFKVLGSSGESLDRLPGAPLLTEALNAIRDGRAENDPVNSLTLEAGLSWREVALVRAYLAAAFQMRLAPARPAARRVLLLHPALARALVDLFIARLDPDRGAPPERISQLRQTYLDGLSAVDNIVDDRVARRLLSMVEATVRTNYFLPIAPPDPYVALKLESAKIAELPDDPLLYEIHVNSPRMEGCHLRAGKVARGGIRFSDRVDDYRTEILGLMKTQTVKNAIIVPVGSKGGFIVTPRSGRTIAHQEVVEAYQTLISAMLDLTDNIVDGRTVAIERVKALDNDGAYLVVAADKGTASFSDIANGIAMRRNFWLGDAFASGGEHGYDHKRLGITARGAWESARRHLREMGRDPDRGPAIAMVGIGDMSGDVFGNGLLQSSNLKLIAAFDHRHIFIDPNPDPKASFAERERLFRLPASSWADYNAALISKGGGVFKRGAKSIALSPEARSALKCELAETDSEDLVRAILRAEVDLLYNGGIGTFVRASDETDAQAGDHANDACRIVAGELRAKIAVEGGNLGFTQKARIEFALQGGRINTDAIDNSAGVDMSDHEVNLKILLQPPVARGALTVAERNRLLAAAADQVAAQVIRDNTDQNRMLSLEQVRSRTQVSVFRDHLAAIEQRGLMRRLEEALPTREALSARRARYPGLTRPELAVLTAYTKIDLTRHLEETPLVNDPYLEDRFLVPYFPRSIAQRFANEISDHRLRRELVATRLVNELVDLNGSTFVFTLMRDCGVEAQRAARAWVIASEILGLREHVERLRASASEPGLEAEPQADAELRAFLELARAADRAARWAIAKVGRDSSIREIVSGYGQALSRLGGEFEGMLTAGEREGFERAYRDLRSAVHQEQLAHALARLSFADHLLNVLWLSFAVALQPERVASVYFGLNQHLNFDLIETGFEALGAEDPWERRAARELRDELQAARIELSRAILVEHRDVDGSGKAVEQGLRKTEKELGEFRRLAAELKALGTPSLAALQVATRAVKRLSAGLGEQS